VVSHTNYCYCFPLSKFQWWRKWWFDHNPTLLPFVFTLNKIIIKDPTRKDTIGFGQNHRHLHYPTSSLLSHLEVFFVLFYSSRNFLITIITTKTLYVNDKKKNARRIIRMLFPKNCIWRYDESKFEFLSNY